MNNIFWDRKKNIEKYQEWARNAKDDFCGENISGEFDLRRKKFNRNIQGEGQRTATRGTVICIFVCGSLLLSLGLALLLTGLLIPKFKNNPTPWLVIGATSITLGILVLLLIVERILKLRKFSKSESTDNIECSSNKPSKLKRASASEVSGEQEASDMPVRMAETLTPEEQLDPAALPQSGP